MLIGYQSQFLIGLYLELIREQVIYGNNWWRKIHFPLIWESFVSSHPKFNLRERWGGGENMNEVTCVSYKHLLIKVWFRPAASMSPGSSLDTQNLRLTQTCWVKICLLTRSPADSQAHSEGHLAIFNNMNGPWGHYAERSQTEKDKYCMISLIRGI